MGSLIVRQVMTDLIPLGLGHSQGTDLLMAGSSAGGTGVMLNLDKVKHLLQVEKGEYLDKIVFNIQILTILLNIIFRSECQCKRGQ